MQTTAGHIPKHEPPGPEPWPLTASDITGLRSHGLPRFPFQQFIIKVNSRCNLACSYCYVYFAADTGWREQPVAASQDTLRRTAGRIAEHAATHQLTAVSLVLHGGEPLLTDPGRLGAFVATVRAQVPTGCTVHASAQTNGTLLTEARLRALASHGIRVGLSLDGGSPEHNRHRVDHAGRPAWPGIQRAARLLAGDHRAAYGGVLCVVDPDTDPAEVYTSLLALDPPGINFLLPHGNWSTPPPGLPAPAGRPAPYGDWLCAVFDLWWRADRRRTRVRLFQECLALLLGAPAETESLGLQPFVAVVVESDGAIEQTDALKTAYEGAAATGLDVFRHSFDDALDHPGVVSRQAGTRALAPGCQKCSLVEVCGGGHYAHRYHVGHGFRHPSVYCVDLQRLIGHIATRLAEEASA